MVSEFYGLVETGGAKPLSDSMGAGITKCNVSGTISAVVSMPNSARLMSGMESKDFVFRLASLW
ncbi:MAG: hypothetical protein IPJ51_11655 [Saprospiraceae bacterium]|nr:hypothetical protein [Saprospiraceae bacterium]